MRYVICAICLSLSGVASALDPPQPPSQPPLGMTSDFLLYHPDQSFRLDGLRAYADGKYDFALRDFRAAARYADKPSQAMLASMYWEGKGVPQDRALAYAWMDLAAERGYPWLLADRERYWNAMSEDERQRAIDVGQTVYAEYGDAAAQPRLEVWLHRGKFQSTGSHAGFVGNLEIHRMSAFGGLSAGFDANTYYAARYWQGPQYWGWANGAWHPDAKGKVDIGHLEAVPDTKAAPAPSTGDDRKNGGGN